MQSLKLKSQEKKGFKEMQLPQMITLAVYGPRT